MLIIRLNGDNPNQKHRQEEYVIFRRTASPSATDSSRAELRAPRVSLFPSVASPRLRVQNSSQLARTRKAPSENGVKTFAGWSSWAPPDWKWAVTGRGPARTPGTQGQANITRTRLMPEPHVGCFRPGRDRHICAQVFNLLASK